VIRRLRQEDHKFEASLGYTVEKRREEGRKQASNLLFPFLTSPLTASPN
jgi:hypothetical protein